jgi:hypothetical protein
VHVGGSLIELLICVCETMSCVHVIDMDYESFSIIPCDHVPVPDCDTIMESIKALLARNRIMDHESLHDRSVGGRG